MFWHFGYRYKMDDKLKYCSKCGVGKPATEEFFSIRSDVKKLHAQCRECRTKKRHEHYLKNKDKALKQSREWKANNKKMNKHF